MYERFYPIVEIRCPECGKRGFRPTLLARVQKAEGRLLLWCKNCRKEVKVVVHGTNIEFEP
jgi:transcription elongation factor Elf1